MTEKKPQDKKLLHQYMGFASQMMAGLALAVFVGLQLDKWIKWRVPVFTALLPLLALIATIVKVVKDTSGK